MVWRWGTSGPGGLGHHPRHDRLRGAPGEGRVAGEHLVEHGPEAVHVGAGRDLPLAHRLLGAHVVRRAERHAGLGHPGVARLARRQRDAEVGHQRPAVVQEDVLGLDVPVNDLMAVRIVERRSHLRGDADRIGHGELLLPAQAVAQ